MISEEVYTLATVIAVVFAVVFAVGLVIALIVMPFMVIRATRLLAEIADTINRIENIQRHRYRLLDGNKPEQSKPASRNKQRSRPPPGGLPPPGGWPQGDGVMAQLYPHEPTQST